jgi:L-amino acid N-acyltransferase YncA
MVVVRDAEVGDVSAISRLHVVGAHARYREILPDHPLDHAPYDKSASRWRAMIASRRETKRHILVAVRGDDVVGFVCGGPERNGNKAYTAELYALYVASSHERVGIGRALFDALVARLRAEGHERMTASVLSGSRVRSWYERRGGVVVGSDTAAVGSAMVEETVFGFDIGTR